MDLSATAILSAIHGPLYAWPGWLLGAWTVWCFAYLRLAPLRSVIPQIVDIHPLANMHNLKIERLCQRPNLFTLALTLLVCAAPVLNLLFLWMVADLALLWRKHGNWRDAPWPPDPDPYGDDD